MIKKCLICGKEFKTYQGKYCSRECYYKMKRIRGDRMIWTDEMKRKMSKKYQGKGNPMFGKISWNKGKKCPKTSGENHFNWKGGYWTTKDGRKYYESVYTEGRAIAESRKIIEEYTGKKLLSSEIIHHINKNVKDNRIKNLMVCTRAEHINIHRKDLLKAKKLKKILINKNISSQEHYR